MIKSNKKNIRKAIDFFIIITTTLGLFFINLVLNSSDKNFYNININKNANYKIILKANKFYITDTLGEGYSYASKSINGIEILFNYNIIMPKETNTAYDYNITANIEGRVNSFEEQNKIIWNREFILLDKTYQNKINKDNILVEKEINVDYEYFNNLVTDYETEYGIKIDAVLKVKLNINIYDKEKIEDNIELEIPLNNSVTEIRKNFENENTKQIILENNNINLEKSIYLILSILFFIIAISLILFKINKIKNEDIYKKELNKILKYYKELIVKAKEIPRIDDLEIIELEIFDDLIDVAEQNQKNIIYHEEKDNKNTFYVIVDKYVYIYKLEKNSTT